MVACSVLVIPHDTMVVTYDIILVTHDTMEVTSHVLVLFRKISLDNQFLPLSEHLMIFIKLKNVRKNSLAYIVLLRLDCGTILK